MGFLDGWRFCPRCATPLAPDGVVVRCSACGFEQWAHSIPGAQALVVQDGKVLLGRRANDPGAGLWDIPGGFLEEGEQPVEGLRRELREETALELEGLEYFGTWLETYGHRSVLCLTWLARPASGEPRAGDDLVELHWFAPDELPAPHELAFASFVEILSRWRGATR